MPPGTFQAITLRASFSTTSAEVCPPVLPRTSTISASHSISVRRSRWKSAQPWLTMSGTCR